VKVWKKVNSPKPEKIWLPLKRITKKSVSKLLKVKVKKKDIRLIYNQVRYILYLGCNYLTNLYNTSLANI